MAGNASNNSRKSSNPQSKKKMKKEPEIPPSEKTKFVIRATEPKFVLGFMCITCTIVIYLIAVTLYVSLIKEEPVDPRPGPSSCHACPDVSSLQQVIKDLQGKVENIINGDVVINGDLLDLKNRLSVLENELDSEVKNSDDSVKRNELEQLVAGIAMNKSSDLNVTITAEITNQAMVVEQKLKSTTETFHKELDAHKNKTYTALKENDRNLNTNVAEVDKKLTKRIDGLNVTLIEVNLKCSQKINDTLSEINSTLSNRIDDVSQNCTAPKSTDELIATLMKINSTLSERIAVVNNTLIEINITHLRRNNDTSATLKSLNSTVSQEIKDTNTALLNVNLTLLKTINYTNAVLVDVNTTLSQKVKNVSTTLVTVNSTVLQQIHDVNSTLAQRIYDINTTLTEFNTTLSQRIHNVNVTLSERISDVNATLSQRVYDVNTTLIEVNSTLSLRIHNVSVTLSQRIYDVNTTLMEVNSSLSQRIHEVNDSLWQRIHELMDTVVGDFRKSLRKASARVSGLWFSFNVMGMSHHITCQHIAQLQETLDSILEFNKKVGKDTLHKLLNLSDNNEKNTHNIWTLSVLVCLGFAAVFVIIIGTCRMIAKEPATVRRGGAAIMSQPLRSVLDQIHQKSLDNKMCILSFYAETQPLHNRLTVSACQTANILQTQFLIGRHEDIPNIPPCKMVLVFVDFNERDIILENPKREVGDLKLTTVKGARKMGADVFVIYVRDKGSMSLKDGLLFNPNLRSIYNHEELNDLNNRERVMSTYESFTHFQKQHLERCIRALR